VSHRAILLGMDIGTTTCRAMAFSVECVPRTDGKGTDLVDPLALFISETELTPFKDERILEDELQAILEQWKLQTQSLTFNAGGVIVTGLAARAKNWPTIEKLLGTIFSNLIMITAEDPRYESWLCFKGSVLQASLRESEKRFLHLDIGGGTTNLSVGKNGEVEDTGSYFIGARHFRFHPGTSVLSYISPFGRKILEKLKLNVGNSLSPTDRKNIAQVLCHEIETLVYAGTCWDVLRQASLTKALPVIDVLSFSGGIAGWIYGVGEDPEEEIPFEDLGWELAQAIRNSEALKKIPWMKPTELGLATVAGLALFGCNFSGRSIFLPENLSLPLTGIPIVRTVDSLGLPSTGGIALFQSLPSAETPALEAAAEEIRSRLQTDPALAARPLVLLVDRDVGKTLGNLITNWGKDPWPVVVLDQVPPPHGQFVHIGKEDRGIVPVSYYGML